MINKELYTHGCLFTSYLPHSSLGSQIAMVHPRFASWDDLCDVHSSEQCLGPSSPSGGYCVPLPCSLDSAIDSKAHTGLSHFMFLPFSRCCFISFAQPASSWALFRRLPLTDSVPSDWPLHSWPAWSGQSQILALLLSQNLRPSPSSLSSCRQPLMLCLSLITTWPVLY